MRIHHIGYAVKDLDKAVAQCEVLGYKKESYTEDLIRNVLIVFMKNYEQTIELVAPIQNGENSDLGDILRKKGPGPYHICYIVPDLDEAIKELQENKFMMIKAPEKACAIENKKVVFMWNKTIGLIELVEN